MNDDPWYETAACRKEGVDPEIFFGESRQSHERAKQVCGVCPVRNECLTDALAAEDRLAGVGRFGVYGGLTGRERSQVAEKRPLVGVA